MHAQVMYTLQNGAEYVTRCMKAVVAVQEVYNALENLGCLDADRADSESGTNKRSSADKTSRYIL